jgi:hypothetical protein
VLRGRRLGLRAGRKACNTLLAHRQLAEAFEVGADFEGGDAFDLGFGIEQGGDLAAEVGSGFEDLGALRQGHAGPVLPQGSGFRMRVNKWLQHDTCIHFDD